jgi:hypothetical protein
MSERNAGRIVIQPDIEKGKAYTNIKTGRAYKALHIAFSAWDTAQILVVYEDIEHGSVWVRSLTEFKEKFIEARE